MAFQPVGLCWRQSTKGPVLPAKVVVAEEQAKGCLVVGPLLGEAVRQSAHPLAEVAD